MMPRYSKIAAVTLIAISLAACNAHTGPKQTGGTLVGAVLGGIVGSTIGKGSGRFAATTMGTMIGAVVGNSIGESLDRVDRRHVRQTAQRSLESSPSGQVSQWRNPDSGNSGTFKAERTYQTTGGRYCREYQQTITVGGKEESAHGTACRQPDGSWEIINAT